MSEIQRLNPFHRGDRVTYYPDHGEPEQGIVKNQHDKDNSFIVFQCDNNWLRYTEYTGKLTNVRKCKYGWNITKET